jgi:hypothetical protein
MLETESRSFPQGALSRRSSFVKRSTRLNRNSQQTHARASALFNKKEEQQREGRKAMAEYEAAQHALRERTAKLRALRLARDALGQQAPKEVSKQVSTQAPTPPARKRSLAAG